MSGVAAAAAGAAISAAAAAAPPRHNPRLSSSSSFRNCPVAAQASSLLDGKPLVPTRVNNGNDDDGNDADTVVIMMPWIAFGTYKLGATATAARRTVRDALSVGGYRHIDIPPLFMAKKNTKKDVGLAIQDAIRGSISSSREEVFITTKHWSAYHGYKATLKCLNLSLQRLQVDYIDLWLMVCVNKKKEKDRLYTSFYLLYQCVQAAVFSFFLGGV
jgi:hypothetical protein